MTPAARVACAIELLDAVLGTQRPADRVVSDEMRRRRYMGSKDRNAVGDQVYRALRHRARYDWWLKVAKLPLDARGWIVADVAAHAPDTVSNVFSGGRFGPEPLNPYEQRLVEAIELHSLQPKEMPQSVLLEVPDWAVKPLQDALGDSIHEELTAMLRSAPMDLRANTLKTDRDGATAALAEEGLTTALTPHSPIGMRVWQRKPLGGFAAFREGLVEVQDEGSQILSSLVAAEAGMHVVDLCAGAGGKTLAISAQMGNKGRITACDIYPAKLERAKERFRRAGVQNARARAIEGTRDRWFKRHTDEFDRVLVDAPCSGTGTWRRNPDARWGRTAVDLEELTALQDQILHRAASIVKPGGRLIYGTCSLLNCENEERVAALIERHPDFSIMSVKEIVDLEGCDPFLKLSPARHGTDGFFGAILVRAESSPTEVSATESSPVES
jgi:16S rRNA (cytosine967-C5)-methyltransferase